MITVLFDDDCIAVAVCQILRAARACCGPVLTFKSALSRADDSLFSEESEPVRPFLPHNPHLLPRKQVAI